MGARIDADGFARRGRGGVDSGRSPFRILILADLTGRSTTDRPRGRLRERRIVPLAQESTDSAMAALRPSLLLQADGPEREGATLEFRSMDDFHPDRIFRQTTLFGDWREWRARGGALDVTRADAAPTLEELLRSGGARGPESEGPGRALEEFFRRVMAPHVVAAPDPGTTGFLDALDREVAARMRALLHTAAFQSLEANWRALDRLRERVELGDSVRIDLLDVAREEIASDELLDALREEAGRSGERAERRGLLVGAFRFEATEDDLAILTGAARLAARAGCAFVAEAHPSVAGFPDDRGTSRGKVWDRFRRSPAARCVGLAAPRFLMRLPYGRGSCSIESFAFEELDAPAPHEHYLWANPAFAVAELIALPCAEQGGIVEPGECLELESLPVHAFQDAGTVRMKPCAETFLSDQASESMLAAGVMPLISIANRDAVRVLRFQTVADPPTGLPGPWAPA